MRRCPPPPTDGTAAEKSESFICTPPVLLGGTDIQHDLADVGDSADDAVTCHHCAHTLRRAGEDQVAGLQVIELRQVGYDLSDITDKHIPDAPLAPLYI